MPLERVSQGFKDISMSFESNPLTEDLIASKNETAIARSIRNIVFTLPGEKFFNPEFGSDISGSLFENIDDLTGGVIEDQIRQSIINYEPRVNIISLVANPDPDNNSYNVTLTYAVVGADIPPQDLEFVLLPNR